MLKPGVWVTSIHLKAASGQDTQSLTPHPSLDVGPPSIACSSPLLGNLAANHASRCPMAGPGHRSLFVFAIAHPGSIIPSLGRNGQKSASYPPAAHVVQHATGSCEQGPGPVWVSSQQRVVSGPSTPPHHLAPTAGTAERESRTVFSQILTPPLFPIGVVL